ncbi:MAG TPA: MFS transporter [Labilithrix sp.]|nr:MFS transporter [Labilithrix sp.]
MQSVTVQPADRFRVGKWGALGILMVLAFLNYMDRNLIYPLLTLIADDLGVSVAELGALSTGFHVVYACTAPLVGAISDRVVRKTVLLFSLVVWSVITALSGTATGFVSLLVWRSLTGAGEGGYFPTAVSLIGDLFEPNRRGLAIGLHGVCTTLGGSAGYAVGGLLGQHFGWRFPFMLALVPGLVLAVVLHRTFDEPPRGGASNASVRTQRRSWGRIVIHTPVLLLSIAACLGAFAMVGMNTFFPMYLTRARGVSVADAGMLTGAFFAVSIVGQLSGGILSDRLSTRLRGARPLLVALPYLAAAPAVFVVTHVPAVSLALVCYGAAQLLRGFAEPNIYGTIIDSTPPSERGSAQGFLLMMTFVGSSVSGYGLGALIKNRGFGAAFDALAASAALAGALAVVLFLHVRRDRAVSRIAP